MNIGQIDINDITPKSMKITWMGIDTTEDTGGDPAIYY